MCVRVKIYLDNNYKLLYIAYMHAHACGTAVRETKIKIYFVTI